MNRQGSIVVHCVPIRRRLPVVNFVGFVIAPLYVIVVIIVDLIDLFAKRADPLVEHFQILELLPAGHLPETGPAHSILGQEVVHELVDICERETVLGPPSQLAVIRQQRLQRLVDIRRLKRQSHVEGRERGQVFEIRLVQILQHNVAARQQLE